MTEYIVERLNGEKWEEPLYVQELIRCRDCEYFVRDYVQNFDGRPEYRIVAHNVCIRDISKKLYVQTENHYCAWAERRKHG